jgi:hypothetical protein
METDNMEMRNLPNIPQEQNKNLNPVLGAHSSLCALLASSSAHLVGTLFIG